MLSGQLASASSGKTPASTLQRTALAAAQRKQAATREMPLYGAVVVGPPGASKSTFHLGRRCCHLSLCSIRSEILLDPACEGARLAFDIDVRRTS